jgi:hypothetical protein
LTVNEPAFTAVTFPVIDRLLDVVFSPAYSGAASRSTPSDNIIKRFILNLLV